MNSAKSKAMLGRLALLVTTLVWGTSFVVMKSTLDSIPTFHLLAFRFTGASLLLALLCIRERRVFDRSYILRGAVMGFLLFLSYVFQTFGLVHTTPGKNAFLTAVYCVLVPFLYWFINKKRPTRYNLAAAGLCVVSVGLISLDASLTIGIGDALTLVGSVFFSLHIIATAESVKNRSAVLLSFFQFLTAAVLACICAAAFEPFPENIPTSSILSIAYLCVMCTAVCFLLQTVGQKYTPPSQAAVILTLESVFGVLVSVIFTDNEHMTLRLGIGFSLMFISVLISETQLSFLKPLFIRLRSDNKNTVK